MSEFPSHARCVVIGAGIVGNCLVGHLSEMGWEDIVLLDKGPLPNPGGSTGHASNFIFPTTPTLSPKFRNVARRSFSMAIAFDCSSLRWVRSMRSFWLRSVFTWTGR